MKLILTAMLLSSLACSATEYINYIRESHFITGVEGETPHYEYHTDIENTNDSIGKLGVLNKTVYDLYVLDKYDLTKEYNLDSKTVYTHAPAAELSIISDGPETSEPFTRADKPFYVTYTVKNLTPQSVIDNPRFNSVVLMSETSTQRLTLSTISENLTAHTVKYFPQPLMGGSDATLTAGSIDFTINENANIDADEFASQDIQIIPKHTSSFTGPVAGEEYYTIPNVTLQLTNMYPGSTAILYVYPNDDPTDIRMIPANGQVTNPSANDPHTTEDLSVTGLDALVDEGGDWTLVWMLTETPWTNELLHEVSFHKLIKLKVRANISTHK